jgi:capsule polysaccharide modification protein KpsS
VLNAINNLRNVINHAGLLYSKNKVKWPAEIERVVKNFKTELTTFDMCIYLFKYILPKKYQKSLNHCILESKKMNTRKVLTITKYKIKNIWGEKC